MLMPWKDVLQKIAWKVSSCGLRSLPEHTSVAGMKSNGSLGLKRAVWDTRRADGYAWLYNFIGQGLWAVLPCLWVGIEFDGRFVSVRRWS